MKHHMSFVLDCSLTMAWCFQDEATSQTKKIRDTLVKNFCVVPSIWSLEVNNVLRTNYKKKRITLAEVKECQYLLSQLPIKVDLKASNFDNEPIFDLANQYDLSCYDAAYLELALRLQIPLASLDKALCIAATRANVNLLLPLSK